MLTTRPRARQSFGVDEFFTPGRPGEFDQFAIYAAQAAEVMLEAIARSDGTRASVTKKLLATRVRDGLIGSFRIDRNGDTTRQTVTILRPTHAGADRNLIGDGSVVVRMVDVPTSLLR
jgi:ABC-type branched-subunit amino acid transport system substrate-binding protein